MSAATVAIRLGVLVLFSGIAAGAVVACGSPTVPLPGVVTGGVIPCSGLPPDPRSDLHYAAATVTVLRGDIVIRGDYAYLPTTVVTTSEIGVNETYRFVLAPGDYVLVAKFPPPSNVVPDVSVKLQGGDLVKADIPNVCI